MRLPQDYRPLPVIVTVSFLLQAVYVLGAPIDRLTSISIVDDAFYYLCIARNIAERGFVSFDGIHPTNGFQPLWQVLILPLGFIESRETALRLLALFGAVLYQAATIALYFLLRRVSSRAVAITAAILWAFNARLLLTYAVSGMEFSLYALTVTLTLLACERYKVRHSTRTLAALGVMAGLCVLTRLDGVFLAGLIGLYIMLDGCRVSGARVGLTRIAVYLAGAALITFPYYAWNLSQFGHLFPVSGALKLHYTRQSLALRGHDFASPGHLALAAREFVYYFAKYLMRFSTGYLYYALRLADLGQKIIGLIGLAALLGLFALRLRRRPGSLARELARLAPLHGFVFAQFLAYAILLFPYLDYGNWYFAPLYLALTVAAAQAINHHLHDRWRKVVIATSSIALLANSLAFLLFHHETKINVMGARECLDYLEKNYSGRRIGAWNAGYLGYFSEKNRIVNLDGLVNDYALADIIFANKPLEPYLKSRNIDLVCDYQDGPETITDHFYSLKPPQYRVLFRSRLHHPIHVEPRINYVLALNHEEETEP